MRISDWSSDVCSSDLLEPMMKVEVVTPDEYMGDIIGDLNSRRGSVLGMDSRGNAQVINAMVPLANMFGYVNTLRSEERRVGKECVSTCSSRWSRYHAKKEQTREKRKKYISDLQ